MALTSDMGRSVKTLLDFTNSKVRENLFKEYSDGGFEISRDDLKRVMDLISLTFDQSLAQGYSEIESCLNKYEK